MDTIRKEVKDFMGVAEVLISQSMLNSLSPEERGIIYIYVENLPKDTGGIYTMSTADCSESMRSPHISYPLTHDHIPATPTIHAPRFYSWTFVSCGK